MQRARVRQTEEQSQTQSSQANGESRVKQNLDERRFIRKKYRELIQETTSTLLYVIFTL